MTWTGVSPIAPSMPPRDQADLSRSPHLVRRSLQKAGKRIKPDNAFALVSLQAIQSHQKPGMPKTPVQALF
jgi:hypothetical protein